jgi:hypothetical protein
MARQTKPSRQRQAICLRNNTEERVLADTLESSLNRLQDKIFPTDAYDYRQLLKERKDVLLKLRNKLQ